MTYRSERHFGLGQTFRDTEPEPLRRSESVGADFEPEPANLPTPAFRLFLTAVGIVLACAVLALLFGGKA